MALAMLINLIEIAAMALSSVVPGLHCGNRRMACCLKG